MSLILSLLNTASAPFFAPLAFPHLRPTLLKFDSAGDLVAVGATLYNWPVGLGLARLNHPTQSELLSIMVLPAYRGKGIASQLLASLEKALSGRGIVEVNGVFPDRAPTLVALERVLAKNGWSLPQSFLRVYRGQVPYPPDYPWMPGALEPPEGFEIFPWADLSQPELAEIKERLATDTRYRGVFVGTLKEDFEPRTSLGLRCEGVVVGWCFTRLVPENRLLYYEGYFVRPDLRRFSRISLGQSLISNVIYRHWDLREEIPNFGFSVELENRHMLRFSARYFEPFCRYVYHLKRAGKMLPG